MGLFPTEGTLTPSTPAPRQPSCTWYLNRKTGRIQGEVDGLEAVHQAVELLLNTQRFRWAIYRPQWGVELDGLLGQDPGYVAQQLRRRIWEALSVDDRIQGIEQFDYKIQEDTLTVTMTVRTVFGESREGLEVKLR